MDDGGRCRCWLEAAPVSAPIWAGSVKRWSVGANWVMMSSAANTYPHALLLHVSRKGEQLIEPARQPAGQNGAAHVGTEVAPVEFPDPELPARRGKTPKSIEDRIKGIENSLKVMTLIVAIAAVVAASVSAYSASRSATAAEKSSSTAKDALDTAREARGVSEQMRDIANVQFQTAGAALRIVGYLRLFGRCGDQGQPLLGRVKVINQGRLAGRLTGAAFGITLPPDPSRGPYINNPTFSALAWTDRDIVINAQDEAELELPFDCSRLPYQGIHSDNAGKELEQRVNARTEEWRVMPSYAVSPSVYSDGKIWSAYYTVP